MASHCGWNSYLAREENTACRLIKRACKRPALVTEQFAFKQAGGQGRAVYLYKWSLVPA